MTIIQHSSNLSTTLLPYYLDFSGRLGLPNSLREKLLQMQLGDAALVLDLGYALGFKAGQLVTVDAYMQRVFEAGVDVSEGLIRRGLACGVLVTGVMPRPGRGRRVNVYHWPVLDDLVKRYCDGWWSATDPLCEDDLACLKVYRQALHREFIKRAPGHYSRAFLARRLGVGKRTTRNYDRAVGIRATQRFEERELNHYVNGDDVVRNGLRGREWLKLLFYDGREMIAPLKLGIYYKFIAEAVIYLVTQLTNHYAWVGDYSERSLTFAEVGF